MYNVNMKNYLLPVLIIGLLLSANLGLATMNHMDGQDHVKCPFDAAGFTNCTQVQSPLDLITIHLNAFSRSFLSTPVGSFFVFLSLLLLLGLAAFVTFSNDAEFLKRDQGHIIKYLYGYFVSHSEQQIIQWLSLHENSPAAP